MAIKFQEQVYYCSRCHHCWYLNTHIAMPAKMYRELRIRRKPAQCYCDEPFIDERTGKKLVITYEEAIEKGFVK